MKKFISLLCLLLTHSGLAGTTRYASPEGSHVPPFDIRKSAATNIQSVVDLSADGDTILIGKGDYFLSSEITVTNAVKLIGENDLEETVINGGGTNRCFNLADVDCVISGITVTNGYSPDDGGGVYGDGLSPIITNCVVTGSSAYAGGGIYRCRIYHSTITGNSAGYEGGGTSESEVYYSTISGNTAVDYGGGVSYGTALNCLIYNNSSLDEGGGVSDGITINCVIRGNTAIGLGGGVAWGELYNCTVISNSSSISGGGTYRCRTYNSIAYYNSATINDSNTHNPVAIISSCSLDIAQEVDGNITNAPLFINMGAGDFHLQTVSPCKNKGNNAFVSTGVDLDRNARVFAGIVDMGAYEVQTTPNDLDGDGMADSWEVDYFGSTNVLPNAHDDSDLFTNLEEYIAGTDPTNGASFFAVTNGLAGESFMVGWSSVSAREYAVLWAESLTNGFVQQGLLIDHPQNSYTDTAHSAESSGFYKVEVRLK